MIYDRTLLLYIEIFYCFQVISFAVDKVFIGHIFIDMIVTLLLIL